jgi:chromosomal replication initiation ATPase DnaA
MTVADRLEVGVQAMRLAMAALIARNRYLEGALITERIVCAVAEEFGLRPSELKRRDKSKRVARPRQVAIWLMRERGMVLTEIGGAFGLHHTTVLHGLRAVAADPELRSTAARLLVRVGGEAIGGAVNLKPVRAGA